MRRSLSLLLSPLALVALPAAAQEVPAPAPGAPNVAAANNAVAVQVEAQGAAQDIAQLDAKGQYAADQAAYDQAVRAYRRSVVRTAIEDDRRRAAYADAMRAWRSQVYDCQHGSKAACNAPSPDPAAFY